MLYFDVAFSTLGFFLSPSVSFAGCTNVLRPALQIAYYTRSLDEDHNKLRMLCLLPILLPFHFYFSAHT